MSDPVKNVDRPQYLSGLRVRLAELGEPVAREIVQMRMAIAATDAAIGKDDEMNPSQYDPRQSAVEKAAYDRQAEAFDALISAPLTSWEDHWARRDCLVEIEFLTDLTIISEEQMTAYVRSFDQLMNGSKSGSRRKSAA